MSLHRLLLLFLLGACRSLKSKGRSTGQQPRLHGCQPAGFGSDSCARLGGFFPVPVSPTPSCGDQGGSSSVPSTMPRCHSVTAFSSAFGSLDLMVITSHNPPTLFSFQDCGDFKKELTASLRRFRAFFTSNGKIETGARKQPESY